MGAVWVLHSPLSLVARSFPPAAPIIGRTDPAFPSLPAACPPARSDGTTTMVCLIGELMKHAERYIADGLHPRIIAEVGAGLQQGWCGGRVGGWERGTGVCVRGRVGVRAGGRRGGAGRPLAFSPWHPLLREELTLGVLTLLLCAVLRHALAGLRGVQARPAGVPGGVQGAGGRHRQVGGLLTGSAWGRLRGWSDEDGVTRNCASFV